MINCIFDHLFGKPALHERKLCPLPGPRKGIVCAIWHKRPRAWWKGHESIAVCFDKPPSPDDHFTIVWGTGSEYKVEVYGADEEQSKSEQSLARRIRPDGTIQCRACGARRALPGSKDYNEDAEWAKLVHAPDCPVVRATAMTRETMPKANLTDHVILDRDEYMRMQTDRTDLRALVADVLTDALSDQIISMRVSTEIRERVFRALEKGGDDAR
jgi:hypothetical protein